MIIDVIILSTPTSVNVIKNSPYASVFLDLEKMQKGKR